MRFHVGAFAALVAIATSFGNVQAAVSNTAIPARSFARVTPFPDGTGKKLYVGDSTHNSIDIYPSGVLNPKQIGRITKGVSSPTDVAVDRNGELYVLNYQPAGVAVYARGATSPYRTFHIFSRIAYYIAVGPSGTIYLMSYALDNHNQFTVLEYDRGSDRIARLIKLPIDFPYSSQGAGIAVDAADNLYVNDCSYNAGGGCSISVYPSKSIVSTGEYNIGNNYPGGALTIDHENQIIVGDPYDDAILAKQLPLNLPGFRSFPAQRAGDYLALDPPTQFLYAVSLEYQVIDIYAFRTGQLLGTMPGNGTAGVAVGP